jgi:ribosomal protein S18 acetylase RimI-like enzyme
VETLERATLAAVPPEALEEIDGWLLGLDRGTVGRAHSAAPLRHAPALRDAVPAIESRYRAQGLAPVFRLPEVAAFDALRAALASQGYAAGKPTLVQTGTAQGLASLGAPFAAALAKAPGDDWGQVFLGEGFDPEDGASRLAILRRARSSVFASVSVDGRIAAVGSACFSNRWCGIHGMRTLPAYRGQGLASSLLAAFGREASSRGIARAFLQVESENAPAQSLYRRAGFVTAWAYDYWK